MAQFKARYVVIPVLILGLAGGGMWYFLGRRHEQPGDELVLYGNVDIREVDLAFNGSERIASMAVEEGDRVHRGQVLARLDTSRLEPAVAQAEAQVAAQQEVVDRLKAGTRPEDIRKARADVQAAQAQAVNSERNYQRMQAAAGVDVVTPQELDNAKTAAEADQARLASARETLALAIAGPRVQDIAAAKATLQADQANLRLLRQRLADAELRAPADGVIQQRIVEPGSMASPQTPVYTLALDNPVWVRAYVSESDLGKIWTGMAAEISTDSFPGKRYAGWVGFISPTAEFTPKSVETPQIRTSLVYQVRIYARNPHGELRLGMPATVHIRLDQPRRASTSQPKNGDEAD